MHVFAEHISLATLGTQWDRIRHDVLDAPQTDDNSLDACIVLTENTSTAVAGFKIPGPRVT